MQATGTAPSIEELRLFDTCVTLGFMTAGVQCLTPDNVLGVMDKHDIAEALVINNESRVIYPRARGNRRLIEWIRGEERLYPVWAIEPPAKPDPLHARGLVEEMLDEGVRAARLMMGVLALLLIWLVAWIPKLSWLCQKMLLVMWGLLLLPL